MEELAGSEDREPMSRVPPERTVPQIDSLVSELTSLLVAVKPTLTAASVRPDSSLTGDLGLDSLDLVELAARLDERYPGVDLTRWLADAVQIGGDRLAGLAVFLHTQIAGQPAAGRLAAGQPGTGQPAAGARTENRSAH